MATVLPQLSGTQTELSQTNQKTNTSTEPRSESKTDNSLVPALRSSVPASEQPVLPASIARLIGAYLYDEDLNKFSASNFFSPGACQGDVDARKAVRENLLLHVFNANPEGVDDFFKKAGVPRSMALIKAGFKEGYESKKFKKFILFREWGSLSALQAAAHTADIFTLVQNLLVHIINDEELLKAGRQQLIEVRQNVSEQKMLVDAANAIYKIEFGETAAIKEAASIKFNTIQESEEFKAQMEAFGKTMDAMRQQLETKVPETKTTSESKDSNKDSNYAENQEFLEPLVNLIKAYIYYYIQFPTLDWKQRAKLWGYVGEWHKRLHPYLHQEFFDEKPFDPCPTFKTAPARGPRRYYDNTPLSLDGLGISTVLGLYKGCAWSAGQLPAAFVGGRLFAVDLRAVAHLYTLRLTDLDKIINALCSLDSAKAFVNNYNAPRLR